MKFEYFTTVITVALGATLATAQPFGNSEKAVDNSNASRNFQRGNTKVLFDVQGNQFGLNNEQNKVQNGDIQDNQNGQNGQNIGNKNFGGQIVQQNNVGGVIKGANANNKGNINNAQNGNNANNGGLKNIGGNNGTADRTASLLPLPGTAAPAGAVSLKPLLNAGSIAGTPVTTFSQLRTLTPPGAVTSTSSALAAITTPASLQPLQPIGSTATTSVASLAPLKPIASHASTSSAALTTPAALQPIGGATTSTTASVAISSALTQPGTGAAIGAGAGAAVGAGAGAAIGAGTGTGNATLTGSLKSIPGTPVTTASLVTPTADPLATEPASVKPIGSSATETTGTTSLKAIGASTTALKSLATSMTMSGSMTMSTAVTATTAAAEAAKESTTTTPIPTAAAGILTLQKTLLLGLAGFAGFLLL